MPQPPQPMQVNKRETTRYERCGIVDVVLVVIEFELVALEVGLVVKGGCSCGSRLLVKRPFWNKLGLSRHFWGFCSRGGSF